MADATTLAAAATSPARPGMNLFERYLTLWVALCIVAGIVLGQAAPVRSMPSVPRPSRR